MQTPDAGGGTASTGDGGTANAGGAATSGGVANGGGGGDLTASEAGESTGGTAGELGTAGLAGMPAKGGRGGSGADGGSSATGGGGSGGALHELAGGKGVTTSSQQTGNDATHGNDGNLATRWCASGGDFPQWWRVDLGASHPLVQVSISFEHPDRKYFYLVETSSDDAVYTQQITASGTGVMQTVALPPAVSARYVRVTVTNATPVSVNGNGTWASFWEFALQGY